MFISVLVRRLKPGKTYEDFVDAWYPDKGFGFAGRGPILARNLEDDREVLALRGIYEIEDEFDFSSDETVTRGRPAPGR